MISLWHPRITSINIEKWICKGKRDNGYTKNYASPFLFIQLQELVNNPRKISSSFFFPPKNSQCHLSNFSVLIIFCASFGQENFSAWNFTSQCIQHMLRSHQTTVHNFIVQISGKFKISPIVHWTSIYWQKWGRTDQLVLISMLFSSWYLNCLSKCQDKKLLSITYHKKIKNKK